MAARINRLSHLADAGALSADAGALSADAGDRPLRLCVLGATLGTGNLGVDALGASLVQGVIEVCPNASFLYQSWDDESVDLTIGARKIRCEGVTIRRRDSLRGRDGVVQLRRRASADWKQRLLPAPATWRAMSRCDAVLDISAGDSFADIYGENVFWYQTQLKLLCLDMGLPLVLMPQTIGPFRSEQSRRVAADIVRRARVVATREHGGLDEIRDLCDGVLPGNVVECPDVAFLLEAAACELPRALADRGSEPWIAINVSGLLYFAQKKFGVAADYAEVCLRLVRWALGVSGSRVLLVPHVIGGPQMAQSENDTGDRSACNALLGKLSGEERQRTEVLIGAVDPARAKYAMSKCDFFIGARMHAFVGATSQGTPGALLAYSKKAAGMTGLIGVSDAVVDLRSLDADQVVGAVDSLYQQREQKRARLEGVVPEVKQRIRRFFAEQFGPAPAASEGANAGDKPTAELV